jgi:hypothetical protein
MLENGKQYKVHTHLGIYVGLLVDQSMDEIKLDQCSWLEHEGRMGACTRNGTYEAAEFLGDGIVLPRASVKMPWPHKLPKADK